jgi:hypothetical protein
VLTSSKPSCSWSSSSRSARRPNWLRCSFCTMSRSRSIGYTAQVLVSHGATNGMDFDQIRTLLIEHFRSRLVETKAKIAKTGRLNQFDRASYENSAEFAKEALSEGWPLIPGQSASRFTAEGAQTGKLLRECLPPLLTSPRAGLKCCPPNASDRFCNHTAKAGGGNVASYLC